MYVESYQWQIGLERILILPLAPYGFDTPYSSLPPLGIATMIPCTRGLSACSQHGIKLVARGCWVILGVCCWVGLGMSCGKISTILFSSVASTTASNLVLLMYFLLYFFSSLVSR